MIFDDASDRSTIKRKHTCAASSIVSSWAATTRSGCSGGSYGALTPVKLGSSPRSAFAYRPFGSRARHTSTGVETNISKKSRFSSSCRFRAATRCARSGEIVEAMAMHPASASSAATSATRRWFSARSLGEKRRSRLSPSRKLSPSSRYAGTPASMSRRSTSIAIVDLPAPDRPVSQSVAPRYPSARHRAARSRGLGCQVTLRSFIRTQRNLRQVRSS